MEVFILTNFYPVSLNLKDKLCIVIGGGKVALRRVSKLLESAAIIKIISPTIRPEFTSLIDKHPNLSWRKAYYKGPKDLYRAFLIFATTDDTCLNKQIWADANALGIFTNVASNGQLSDFIVPSSFNRGNLQVSVSTSGKVPGLSKAIKENLEGTLGPEYETLINLLEQVRTFAITDSTNKTKNRHILKDITANYLSILEDLNAGIDTDTLGKQLLGLLQ